MTTLESLKGPTKSAGKLFERLTGKTLDRIKAEDTRETKALNRKTVAMLN